MQRLWCSAGIPTKIGKVALKVLLLTPQLKIGGTERHIQRLSEALKQFGVTPIIVCIQPDDSSSSIHSELLIRSIPVHFFKFGILNVFCFIKLIKLIKNEQVDVIHSFIYGNTIWDSALYFLSNTKIFITERRNLQHWRLNSSVGIFERLRNLLTTAIIANSNRVKETVMNIEGVPEDRIKVIYNGIEKIYNITKAQKKSARLMLGFKPRDFIGVNVSNLKRIKNQEDIIIAMKHFYERHPDGNFYLLLVGRADRKYQLKLQALCKEYFLEDKVFFFGEQTSIKHFLLAADVFILSSLVEGFSNAVLEALSYGLPVISSDVGGISEIIKPDQNGYLYKSCDTKKLMKLLEKLSDNSILRSKLSKKALSSLDNHRMDRVLREYLEVYRFGI